MTSIDAIYKNGTFHPIEPIELPEDCRVKLQVESIEPPAGAATGIDSVYEMLSRRFRSGRRDLAERHNEHQP